MFGVFSGVSIGEWCFCIDSALTAPEPQARVVGYAEMIELAVNQQPGFSGERSGHATDRDARGLGAGCLAEFAPNPNVGVKRWISAG